MFIKGLKLKSKSASTFVAVDAGGNEYLLHSDAIVQYKIKSGEVDNDTFFACVELSSNLIATNLAVKYLNSSIKTEKQIKDYLYKKGYHSPSVNYAIKKDEIAENLSEIDELPSCLKSAQKFVRSHTMDQKNLQKLTRHLAGQGYGWDTIRHALSKLDFDVDED